jgi:hypothetical protein
MLYACRYNSTLALSILLKRQQPLVWKRAGSRRGTLQSGLEKLTDARGLKYGKDQSGDFFYKAVYFLITFGNYLESTLTSIFFHHMQGEFLRQHFLSLFKKQTDKLLPTHFNTSRWPLPRRQLG